MRNGCVENEEGKLMKVKKRISEHGNVYLTAPLVTNIQLNDYCPLSCPFCFMKFNKKDEMSIGLLEKYLRELNLLGCRTIVFGQGEPMVCSKIYDAVRIAGKLGFRVKISTGGAGCTYNKLFRLYKYGLKELNVSINSFDKEVNSKSRDGYEQAINAMKIAVAVGLPFKVTYVAQEETMVEFETYAQRAAALGAVGISILREKVNSLGGIGTYTYESLLCLAEQVRKSPIPVEIEECFCELKILLTNKKNSPLQGCAAGRELMAIATNGEFMPCPHLHAKRESFSSVEEYWTNSPILYKLRDIVLDGEPCSNCKYIERCASCQAIYPDKLDDYYTSRKNCSMYKLLKEDCDDA